MVTQRPQLWWIDANGVPLHPNPRHQIIGQRIRYLRRINQDESTRALAETLGITVGAIKQWETGKTTPSSESVIDIAIHYDVSTDFILCVEFRHLSDEQLRTLSIRDIERSPYVATNAPMTRTKGQPLNG